MTPGNGCQVEMLPCACATLPGGIILATKTTPAAQNDSLGSLFKLADVALSAAESFAALNVATARQALADGARNTKAVLSVKNAEDAAKVQSALTKPSSDNALQYSQKAYEISADAAKELAKVFQDQFEQMNRSLRDLAQRTAHVGTTGVPGTMAPFNQVFEAANKAFENINEAVRQATENAQAMTRK